MSFGEAAPSYLDAGWQGVLPVPEGGKRPNLRGYTGYEGQYPSATRVEKWCRSRPKANLALRLEPGQLGIDVDAHSGKHGAATLSAAEIEYGQLPATWRSTSRPEDPVSGIRWFRVPEARKWRDLGGNVETIWWAHRYAVVWPSRWTDKDGTEREYVWFDPDDRISDRVPKPDEFPELPPTWIGALTKREPPEPGPATLAPSAEASSDRAIRWAEAGFARELETVAGCTSNRNDQLNRSAHKLGRRVAGRLLDADTVRDGLIDAARANGLHDDDPRAVLATIKSGIEAGMRKPVTGPAEPMAAILADSAWEDIDLRDLLTHDPEPIPRFGKGRLIYEGSLMWFYGDPSSGKSVLTYGWAMDVIDEGGHVLLMDEETNVRDVAAKFRALGLRPEQRGLLHYLQPSSRNLLREADRFVQKVADTKARLVIVDSASLHLTLAGRRENDNGEVADFIARALLPVARMGHRPAVVVIDHVVKSDEGRKWARGAGSKLSAADTAFGIDVKEPFSRARSGVLTVTCHKDRFGEMTAGEAWRVTVESGDGRIRLSFEALDPDELASMAERVAKGPNPAKDARITEQLLAFVRANPGVGKRAVRACVSGVGSTTMDRLVEQSQIAGSLRVEVLGNTHKHYAVDQPGLPRVPS